MCRAPAGSLGLRLSEWRLQALRQLLAQVLASWKLPNRSSLDAQAAPTAVILLQNLSGIDLQFGQVGTEECISIADGTSMPYR